MMKALILVAHGSREQQWCAAFERMHASLQRSLPGQHIFLCYLELAKPCLDETLMAAAKSGVNNIVIWPLFMAVGAHVHKDIARAVELFCQEQKGYNLEVLLPFGQHPVILQAMHDLARDIFKSS